MIALENQKYNEIINQKGLVVVDFFATWCGPCQMLLPVMEDLSNNELKEIPVYKIDIDKHKDLAIENQVRSVPTLIVYKDGVEVARQSGFQPKQAILNWLASL